MQSSSERSSEIATKLQRLRAVMAERGIATVVLRQLSNIAWLTAGASTYVNTATDTGPSTLLITHGSTYFITDAIEATRIEREEAIPSLGFTLTVEPWYERGSRLATMLTGDSIAQDGPGIGVDFSKELQDLRTHLQPEEVTRLRYVGAKAGEAIGETMLAIRPGMTEYAIAGLLANACLARGGQAIVNLVASDERIFNFRHPLPTEKAVERYVMVVVCLRHQGLIASATRLVHFGPIPENIAERSRIVASVDAQMILGTRAGKTMGDMFELAKQAYQDAGYPTAISEHHQGGSTGYMTREVLALPGNPTAIDEFQAFAWNPSLQGAKIEDTILLGSNGPEIMTPTPDWPLVSITHNGQTVQRPAVLEV
jgi:Xaa-Pro aminopeptidase